MNIQKIKTIKLQDFLASLGHTPIKQQGNKLWYLSPFRTERQASFKVNTEINQWYDFGVGKGGNIMLWQRNYISPPIFPILLDR